MLLVKKIFKTLKTIVDTARLVNDAKQEIQRRVEPISIATDVKTGKVYPVFLCQPKTA